MVPHTVDCLVIAFRVDIPDDLAVERRISSEVSVEAA